MLCVLSPVYGSLKDLTSVIYQFTKQTYKGDRILIILDDSPTKAPQSFFDNFDMTYVCYIHEGKKKPISLKRQLLKDIAIKDFGGMYMVCMDSDDIYNKKYLSSMVSLLKAGNHLVSCKDLIYFVPSSRTSVYKKTITTKNFAIHAALGFTKEYALNHNYKTTVTQSEISSFTNNFSRNVAYLPGIQCCMIHCHKGTVVDHFKMFNSKNALPQSVQDQLVKEHISEDPKIRSLVLPNKFVNGLSYVTKKKINVTENNVNKRNVTDTNDDIEILDGGYISDVVKPRAMSGLMKPTPVKKEPVKIEPVKIEPVKIEPVKIEPVKIEPVKIEPVKIEPVKIEPVKIEPVKEPVKIEPVKIEPVKNEPVKKEPVKIEPVKIEPVKIEPVKIEPVKIEPVKIEPVKEPVKIEPVKIEPVKIEPVKIEPVKIEPVNNKSILDPKKTKSLNDVENKYEYEPLEDIIHQTNGVSLDENIYAQFASTNFSNV
jgi:hypothetical protein